MIPILMVRGERMNLIINRDVDTPIYLQVKKQIQDMIHSGTLREGFKLPPERKLAESLGINRSTVLKAYQELKADGLIGSHVGKGTEVLRQPIDYPSASEKQVYPIYWNQFFNSIPVSSGDRIIADIMEINSRENIISFAAGIPSPDLYPVRIMEKIHMELYKSSGYEIFLHGPVDGHYPLRESISKMLSDKGIISGPREIMILSGSQQGIDLASRVFLSPDDVVFVEEPTYLGAIQIFRNHGARIIGVPIDSDGMRVDILESLLGRYKPKFIYTIPTFQNPSGAVMSMERRYKLLELAYSYQVPILEDDPYGELRYEGKFLPPLKSIDSHGYVMYLSTFSKTVFLGLRIGWLSAPPQVISRFSLSKQASDLHANTLSQWLFDSFLRNGLYRGHIDMVCKEYTRKRDIMLNALEKYKVPDMSWNNPNGGFYIWLKVPDRINLSKLLAQAAAKGVAFVPGEAFYPNGGQMGNYIRLNFSFPKAEQIETGIKKLMEGVKETFKEEPASIKDIEYYKKPII